MPVYLQIILLVFGFIVFVLLALYAGGVGVRRTCFKIIAELEEAGAFKESKAMKLQDERKNFFLVGANNLRPKALNVLLADKLVIRTSDGRYYLDREKLAEVKNNIGR